MLRVGREGIVTFPNFGYWRHRLQILCGTHAGVERPALRVVRHTQYPSVHDRRFRELLRQSRHSHSGEKCHGRRPSGQLAAQPARLAGGLSFRSGGPASPEYQRHDATFHGLGAVHAPHADLRVYRLQLGIAALPPAQPVAGMAAHRRHQSQGDRRIRADPVSLHLEIPLGAVPGSLRGSGARPPARLDAADATRAHGDDRLDGHALAARRTVLGDLRRDGRGLPQCHPGHRDRRLPPRIAVECRAGLGQCGPC